MCVSIIVVTIFLFKLTQRCVIIRIQLRHILNAEDTPNQIEDDRSSFSLIKSI